jgi:hypothetical protein
MDQDEMEARLQHSQGRTIDVAFGGRTETVVVVSADRDGFVCRMQSEGAEESAGEFWIAYQEISAPRRG